ncbi:hypothetical protein GEMRC1_012228 [Eukaryota sp. GEM-RC1]
MRSGLMSSIWLLTLPISLPVWEEISHIPLDGSRPQDAYKLFYKLFSHFTIRNIFLYMFIEGKEQHEYIAKFETSHDSWERTEKCRGRVSNLMYDAGEADIETATTTSVTSAMLRAASDVGFQLVVVNGEGDSYMAASVKEGLCHAVWSGDSDFLVFPKCKCLFQTRESHSLKTMIQRLEEGDPLKMLLIPSHEVLTPLGLRKEPDLIEFAMMVGCDFTKNKLDHFHDKIIDKRLDYKKRVAEIARQLDNHSPRIKNIWLTSCNEDETLKKAVDFSRSFYKCENVDLEDVAHVHFVDDKTESKRKQLDFEHERQVIYLEPSFQINNYYLIRIRRPLIEGITALFWHLRRSTNSDTPVAPIPMLYVGQISNAAFCYDHLSLDFNCMDHLPPDFPCLSLIHLEPGHKLDVAFELVHFWATKNELPDVSHVSSLIPYLVELHDIVPKLSHVCLSLYYLSLLELPFLTPVHFAVFSFVYLTELLDPQTCNSDGEHSDYPGFISKLVFSDVMRQIHKLFIRLKISDLHGNSKNSFLYCYLANAERMNVPNDCDDVIGNVFNRCSDLLDSNVDPIVELLIRFIGQFYEKNPEGNETVGAPLDIEYFSDIISNQEVLRDLVRRSTYTFEYEAVLVEQSLFDSFQTYEDSTVTSVEVRVPQAETSKATATSQNLWSLLGSSC